MTSFQIEVWKLLGGKYDIEGLEIPRLRRVQSPAMIVKGGVGELTVIHLPPTYRRTSSRIGTMQEQLLFDWAGTFEGAGLNRSKVTKVNLYVTDKTKLLLSREFMRCL